MKHSICVVKHKNTSQLNQARVWNVLYPTEITSENFGWCIRLNLKVFSSQPLSCNKFHRSLAPSSWFTSWSKIICSYHTKPLKLFFGCSSVFLRTVTPSICFCFLAALEVWTSASHWRRSGSQAGIDQIWLLMRAQRKMRQPPSSTDKEKSGFFSSTY